MKSCPIFLIVNADDFGLVPSVSEGIWEAHRKGIVTSVTAFANRIIGRSWVQKLKKSKTPGIGLHLNITFGKPISCPKNISSLLDENGLFQKTSKDFLNSVRLSELESEWTAQIAQFQKIWGFLPDHLDSHHHVHAHARFWRVFLRLVKKLRVPFRIPKTPVPSSLKGDFSKKGISLPDFLWGNMDPGENWDIAGFSALLNRMKTGIHEVVCHPGFLSEPLSQVSSFREGREEELKALTSHRVAEIIKKRNIQLINFRNLVC